jgi:hypothetical protein
VAIILAQRTAWVCAGLALHANVSFGLGLRWLQQRRVTTPPTT